MADKINSFIYQVCVSHPSFEQDTLIIGERHNQKLKKENTETIEELTQLISTEWRQKIHISRQYQELWGEKSTGAKIAYGNLIHNILAQVTSTNDISDAVNEFVEQGMIAIQEVEFYVNEISEIISIDGVSEWFKEGVKVANEKEIIAKDGNLYRPDKVIMLKDKTIVLDFKTGKKRNSYANQLNNYGELLADMNYPKIEKYLLFTKERELIPVLSN